jgi:hypothetical protein
MTRSIIILLLIVAVSLAVFKVLDKNAGAQEGNELSQVLENQKMILEKLNVIEGKVDGLRTRIR